MDNNETQKMIEGVEKFREVVRGMIAALIDDGFTDAQARVLVVGMFASNIK